MKYKNLDSAVHNFAHSFISRDHTRSGKLVHNLLIRLNNNGLVPKIKFDFFNETVLGIGIENKNAFKLLEDYKLWLPEHLENHKCSTRMLEALSIEASAEFDKAYSLPNIDDFKQIKFNALIEWKAQDRKLKTREIFLVESLRKEELREGLYEF